MKIRLLQILVVLSISGGTLDIGRQTQQANLAANVEPNLATIGRIGPKGRVQDRDYNHLPIIDELIAQGSKSIPYLISKLDDETIIDGPVMDYWYQVAVGDVALIILKDFFTDSSWQKTTIPGVGWDEFLGRFNRNVTGEQLLRDFIDKHGRKTIKARWTAIWARHRNAIMWDGKERCFRLCPSISVSCPPTRESPLVFTATVEGIDASNQIEYVWRLTAGKIASGQGSKRIVVDASVAESRGLTGTVEILGFPSGCGNTASCSLSSH